MRSSFPVLCGWGVPALVTVAAAGCESAGCPPARAPEQAITTAPASTSQPASEIVLVRVGDKAVVTQAEFEKRILWVPADRRYKFVRDIVERIFKRIEG